jgi:hypothetical protein
VCTRYGFCRAVFDALEHISRLIHEVDCGRGTCLCRRRSASELRHPYGRINCHRAPSTIKLSVLTPSHGCLRRESIGFGLINSERHIGHMVNKGLSQS